MAKKSKTKGKKSFSSYVMAITAESYGIETEIFSSTAELMKQIREGNFAPDLKTRFFSFGPEMKYEMSFSHVPVTKKVVHLKAVSK